VRNGLPTNENRCYRHIAQDASCELCYSPVEDCYHAVMACPHARDLRLAMREVWDLPPEEGQHFAGPEWFLVLLDTYRKEDVGRLATILWRAWSVSNEVTRAGEPLSIDDSVYYLKKLEQELNPSIESASMEFTVRGRSNLSS
jgi:hypothetical protein